MFPAALLPSDPCEIMYGPLNYVPIYNAGGSVKQFFFLPKREFSKTLMGPRQVKRIAPLCFNAKGEMQRKSWMANVAQGTQNNMQ